MNMWSTIMGMVNRQRDIVVSSHMVDDDRSKKATLTDASWVTNPMFGSPRKIDFSELEDYEHDITVQAAVNFIIDSVATCEWDVVPDEDLEDVADEPDATEAITFFNAADWEESFETVLRGVVADTLMYDSGVLVVTYPEFCYDEHKTLVTEGVAPLQLRARDGRSFIKQVSKHGDILKYWQYSFINQGAKPVEFDTTEIIYVQERPSTRSPYGTSKLEVIKNVADLMMAVQLGHRAENENALQIGGVINHPDVTDAERLRALSAMYNARLKGEHNKNAWLVTGGNVDIKPINANVSDDSWIPGSEFYQQQILSIFKVPKTVLGITSSDTNRATAVAQSTNFKRMGVSTMLSLIEKVLTREIVKRYFNDKLVFRFVREIDLADEVIRAEIDAKNVATGVRTVNELRTRDGLEEIEEIEEDDEGYEFGDEYGEFESLDGLTPDESAEIGKGVDTSFLKTTVHVPASGGRIAYSYERTMQERHTDNLLTGVESILLKREDMMQAGDKLDGIDPEIGKQRRVTKAAGRSILMAMEAKRALPQEDFTAGMKELLDRGDIEKKAGKGYKMTKQGRARVKAIHKLTLRAVENVPTRPDDVNKSGGVNRVWIRPTGKRKGHWRNVRPGMGSESETRPKSFKDIVELSKKELSMSSKEFIKTGKVEFGEGTKRMLQSVKDGEDLNKLYTVNKTMGNIYKNSDKLSSIHTNIRDEWIDTPNGEWTGVLKDSVQRKYGNEVVHHGGYDREVVDIDKWDEYIDTAYDEIGVSKVDVDKYVELQKNLTDSILNSVYPDKSTFDIYRGTDITEIGIKMSDGVKIKQNSVSSWTLVENAAKEFAEGENGIAIKMVVNKDLIWSTFYTHQHHMLDQHEMIVIGDKKATGEVIYVGGKQ